MACIIVDSRILLVITRLSMSLFFKQCLGVTEEPGRVVNHKNKMIIALLGLFSQSFFKALFKKLSLHI